MAHYNNLRPQPYEVKLVGVLMVAAIISAILAFLFMFLWIRERRHAAEAEIVAYGLRSNDESDENTKTSISVMESEYVIHFGTTF